MAAPPGLKLAIAPAKRSAQSLGRNARPLLVKPWMNTSLGLIRENVVTVLLLAGCAMTGALTVAAADCV
jgi:hypothetical protein